MAKKKTKKKIVARKKPAKRKRKALKHLAEMPENVYGQKIDLAQEIAPLLATIIEPQEAEEPEEPVEPQIEMEELVPQESDEIMPVKVDKDLNTWQKTVLMYAAIGCIMCVILFFWIISVKNSLGQSVQEPNKDEGLSAIFGEIQSGVNKIGIIIDNQKKQITDFTAAAKSIIVSEQLKNEVTNKLKEQLQDSNLNLNTNQ